MKDGQPIRSGGPIKITRVGKEHRLVVKEAELTDQANYTCQVRDKTSTAELIVEGKLPNDVFPQENGLSCLVIKIPCWSLTDVFPQSTINC